MIEIVELSPGNERPVADRLAASIRSAWPDLSSNPNDRVTIVLGLRTIREIDLLVFVELATPRDLAPRARRDGTRGPSASIQAAALAIEVKQLEQSRFTTVGTEIFPDYGRGERAKSVNAQVDGCVLALRSFKRRYGGDGFYVHGIGWLTNVAPDVLEHVNPWIVGSDAGWLDIVDAAAQQSALVHGPKPAGYREAIASIRNVLTRTRTLSPRDKSKADELCRDTIDTEIVAELAGKVGTQQVRVTGRGGSGKTTTLALLAKRLATIEGERVLILTYHKALRGDIAHLVDTLVDVPGVRSRIRVETAYAFFASALDSLGVSLPTIDDRVDYAGFSTALVEARRKIVADPELMPLLRSAEPARFDYDYVFVDEAQDWTVAERDFVRAAYGATNLVVADGLEQLVRHQTSCDWHAGLAKADRFSTHLGRSLRMSSNVATFANLFAAEVGMREWSVTPVERFPGGRIVVIAGGEIATPAAFDAIRAILEAGAATPIDALVCVPPPMVRADADGRRESSVAADLRAAGADVWDACDASVRDTPPTDPNAWRVVQYDSCRGLEGWVSVAFGLDQLIATKLKYPNLEPGGNDTPENVANRWLMIALTRAVHMLVIAIADANAPIVATLRAVTAKMPAGVVEWTNGAECAEHLTSPDVGR
jgi:hypothetical protein